MVLSEWPDLSIDNSLELIRDLLGWEASGGEQGSTLVDSPPPLPLLLLPVMVCLTEATIKTNPFVQISIEFLLPCLLRVTVNEE